MGARQSLVSQISGAEGNEQESGAHNQMYLDQSNIPVRRYDAPILTTYFPTNESFRRSILYQGAIAWNALTVEDRSINTHLKFKNFQKKNLL